VHSIGRRCPIGDGFANWLTTPPASRLTKRRFGFGQQRLLDIQVPRLACVLDTRRDCGGLGLGGCWRAVECFVVAIVTHAVCDLFLVRPWGDGFFALWSVCGHVVSLETTPQGVGRAASTVGA
jgi:hypothetical protein